MGFAAIRRNQSATSRGLTLALAVMAITGCTAAMDAFPLNDAAKQIGDPKIEFVKQGIDRGPVTITMPDGETLQGYYHVDRNESFGFGFSGTHTATALAVGDGGSEFVARGPKTEMLCAVHVAFSGHGEGKCQTADGAVWAVNF